MAKPLVASNREEQISDTINRTIDFYYEALHKKADIPDYKYPPVYVGNSWRITKNGYWALPRRTLGWEMLGWAGQWLQHGRDEPWRFTMEQARVLLWWYAIDEEGNFIYRDGVFQRMKGHGKDPFGACLCALELVGPCRFLEFWHGEEPVLQDRPDAWVQTAAVSLEQTKNTMRLFPALFTREAKKRFDLQIGKEQIYGLGGERFLQAHTSSPTTMEGNRVTFGLGNETHLWLDNNDGHEMAAVMRRNAAKAPDGSSRILKITNAYQPGEDSVAEKDRDAYEKLSRKEIRDSGLFYDSIEAAPEAPLSAEEAPFVVPSVRGDSTWLQPRAIIREIIDIRNPPSQSRRWWYNQIVAAEDAWITRQEWDRCADKTKIVLPGEEITVGFDGSKSDDWSAMVGCRVSDSHLFPIGLWDPSKYPGKTIPRLDVNRALRQAREQYVIVGMYADYQFWETDIDTWEQEMGNDMYVKATGQHVIRYDMRTNIQARTKMVESFHDAIVMIDLTHDGDPRTSQHAYNARRRPNQYGVEFGKESRESPKKVDWLAAAMLARQCRQDYAALPPHKKRRAKTGRAMFAG